MEETYTPLRLDQFERILNHRQGKGLNIIFGVVGIFTVAILAAILFMVMKEPEEQIQTQEFIPATDTVIPTNVLPTDEVIETIPSMTPEASPESSFDEILPPEEVIPTDTEEIQAMEPTITLTPTPVYLPK